MAKEEKKNNWNLKKGTIVGVAIFVVISIILGVLVILTGNEVAGKKKRKVFDPELARAMTYEQFQDGDENIEGTDNVKFSAFFLRDLDDDGYAEMIKGTCKQIGKQDTMYMEVNVLSEGKLKNGKIQISGQNFYMQTALPKDTELKQNYIGNNVKTIEFNELNNGTQKLLTAVVRSGDYSNQHRVSAAIGNNINNYSREDNKIIFTGTYVAENGEETEIRKEIPLTVDWYGTTKTVINPKNEHKTQIYKDLANRIDEGNGLINLVFSIYTQEKNEYLILSKNHVEGTLQEFNGYAPVSVTCANSNVEFNYDEETRKFTIDRVSSIGEDGKIETALSRENNYTINMTYPLEALTSIGSETVVMRTPVEAYYEGYNNENEEFTNPYRSPTETAIVSSVYNYGHGDFATNVYVGEYTKYPDNNNYRYVVSKEKPLNIYNGRSSEEKEDIYKVRWAIHTGNNEISKVDLKEDISSSEENGDQFVRTNATKETMENITTNIGIGFSEADLLLNNEGEIKVYDDVTGNLLLTVNKTNVRKYTENNPYKYEVPVKHIRVEITGINKNIESTIVSIKELDDNYITENYTLEEFEQIGEIESHLKTYVNGEYKSTKINIGHYESNFSYATISLSKNTISTQGTEKNDIITINAQEDNSLNQIGWLNGNFLIKLPEEILDLEINDIYTNNDNIEIVSYELVKQGNNLFIKINTENKTENPESYQIMIDCNISPDPRKATTTKQIELYATNEKGMYYYKKSQDIYDVNGNLNTVEQINKTTAGLTIVAPGSLITAETATNYDSKGSITISPQVADVEVTYGEAMQEELTADVSVYFKNNYTNAISDIVILGNIPFEGNKYVISNNDLGSQFSTKMKNTGIVVPQELQSHARVYYSDVEEPTKDLTDETNNWKTAENVTNWDNIKTYLIVLNDYTMPVGKEIIFNYVVQIPNGLEFNKEAYCEHGVYFSLNTESGKYRTQTEPNKIGFRIAQKYNVELTKYQIGKEKKVKEATYRITEEGQNEGKTGTTDENGKFIINNLYAERVYIIEEIRSPIDYKLNPEKIKIIGHVDRETGNLSIEKLEGTTRNEITVIKEEGQNYLAKVEVEDEEKVGLKIEKKDQDTNEAISKVRYRITKEGMSNGKTITTDENGEAILRGLEQGKIYKIEETKAEGYYIGEDVYFKVIKTNEGYEVKIVDEEGNEQENNGNQEVRIEIEDEIPVVVIKLEDEKIPQYNLEITKIKHVTKVETGTTETEGNDNSNTPAVPNEEEITYLPGAKFKLYKDGRELGTYVTDTNGKLIIPNLYAYEESKDLDQTYLLKETEAPEGYTKVKDIVFRVVKNGDGTFSFEETLEENQIEKEWTAEENNIKVTVEDNPSFKLIKKDGETGSLLPNTKFAIYNVDDIERPATNSKGEIIGTKETINGKEYYVVVTDQNGEITADLPEGMYKIIEVEADEKYDISGNTYYFGIGISRETRKELVHEAGDLIGTSIRSVDTTNDGGYIIGGNFTSEKLELSNGDTIINPKDSSNKYYSEGIIAKYSKDLDLEWYKVISGLGNEYIYSVAVTSDGGFLVGGYFDSSTIELENGEVLTNRGNYDGIILKYSSSGEIEWTRLIGGGDTDLIYSVTEINDRGFIVGGYYKSQTIELENGETVTNKGNYDTILLKYDINGELEWTKTTGSTGDDYINSVSRTNDGGFILAGALSGTVTLENGESVVSKGNYDGIIIKYSSNGQIQWKSILRGTGYDIFRSAKETSDGGFIVGGSFSSATVELSNGESLNRITKNSNYYDGIVIKYDQYGDIEWSRNIGGEDYWEHIYSVTEMDDGGYVAGGFFFDGIIEVQDKYIRMGYPRVGFGGIIKFNSEGNVIPEESGVIFNGDIYSIVKTDDGKIVVVGDEENGLPLSNGNCTLTANGNAGTVLKISTKDVETSTNIAASMISGSSNEYITALTETDDGGYLTGGYFTSPTIELKNGEIITNHGTSTTDVMIIKYDNNDQIEWTKTIGGTGADYIYSAEKLNDGGIVVGIRFNDQIVLENGETYLSNGTDSCIIIKYTNEGNIQWVKRLEGTESNYINSIKSTDDGGFVAAVYFSGTMTLDDGENIVANAPLSSGMIIKFNSNGETEWGKLVASISFNRMAVTTDGGIVIGSYYGGNLRLANGELIPAKGTTDGVVIKYNKFGEIEWIKTIGNNNDTVRLFAVSETSDEGVLAGGCFSSKTLDLGNGKVIENRGTTTYAEAFLVKYDKDGNTQWAKSIGGPQYDTINAITSTKDGGFIVTGDFESTLILLDENNSLKNRYYGGLIKYDVDGNVEWSESILPKVNHIIETTNREFVALNQYTGTTLLDDETKIDKPKGPSDVMVLKIKTLINGPELNEISVENNRKEYKISTKVNRIDGIKGGTISGDGQKTYETVKYGDDSTKEIKMVPDENYEIIDITVNGEKYQYTVNEDGTFTMPQFENVKEDIHVEVTYSLRDNKITLNKVDSKTGEGLQGAKFRLDQIEEREVPDNNEIIGEIINNGNTYNVPDLENNITESVLGELTNNGTHYFVQNEDGKLIPTNGKTYQVANGGTDGIGNTTANSYMKIDLRGMTGKYYVRVNANVSSQGAYDYGYITVNKSATAPAYSTSSGRFVYISGLTDEMNRNRNYTSTALQGGSLYYLHFGYRKDAQTDSGDDQIVINSINVYTETARRFGFEEVDGKLESTNTEMNSTTCNSYIPIDLTNYVGKYKLVVNANISSQSYYDYGYAAVTRNTTAPSYTATNGRFIYITGTSELVTIPTDYTTVLDGGQTYYLHLGYYKDSSKDNGDDKFTINSIRIELSEESLYHTEVETNSEGKAITQIPFGKYAITEVQAPEGYSLPEEPTIVEFRGTIGAVHEFMIENKKIGDVIVHHYVKGTEEKVAEDETISGNQGEKYTTSPKIDLEKYELEVDEEGEFILPENAIGEYQYDTQEVIYYYVPKTIPLTVHHYIEGTSNPVPLANGELVEDVESRGAEYEEYTTSALENDVLAEDYELVEEPENKEGTFEYPGIEVTYYYKKVRRNIVINKLDEDGVTYLPGVTFEVIKVEEDTELGDNGTDTTTGESTNTPAENGDETTQTAGDTTDTPTTGDTGDTTDPTGSGNDTEPSVDGDTTDPTTGDDTTDPTAGNDANSVTSGDENIIATVTTDANGKVTIPLEAGTYRLREVAPIEGYEELEDEIEIEVTRDTKENEEVNITNEKRKGKVIVHYYVEGTTQRVTLKTGEIAEDIIKTGLFGEIYATQDLDTISEKYELVSTTENTSGEFIDGEIEVIYYYKAVPARIIVHHYVMDREGNHTEEKVLLENGETAEDEVIDGYVTDPYITEPVTPEEQYRLKEIPTNAAGAFTLEEQEITYYYQEKPKQVIVHHYLEDTETKVSEDVIIENWLGEEYTTSPATDIDNRYILYEEPENKEGTMAEEVIHVIYRYTLKDGKVIAKYIDKLTGEEIAQREEINGKYDDQYEVHSKEIEHYKLIEHTGNESGIITSDEYEVIYYYLHEAKAKVQYVDLSTGRIMEEIETENGLVGDIFETIAKDFEGYVLVSRPEEPTIILTEEQILVYGYIHVSGGVIEKHIDIITGEILDNKLHEGNEGDSYETAPKTFEGYDLVESRLPTNPTGVMTREPKEVIYYYKYRTSITAKYVDRQTGEELAQRETINGHEGDSYTTERKIFDDYVLVEVPKNADGKMKKEPEVVTYYYKRNTGGVIVNHIDIKTGKQLVDERKIEGYEGDSYETEAKIIDGYDIVADRLPSNAKGEMTIEPIRVTYYYIKKAKVIVDYIDIDTNELLGEEEIEGHEGDKYKTEEKSFVDYILVETSDNKKGTMKSEIIERPDGTKEIKNVIKVVYKYKRQKFNLEIDKKIESIIINGKKTAINGDLGKVEVHRKELSSAKVQVIYSIKVTNTEDLKGKATIQENIPEGMTMVEGNNPNWKVGTTTATLKTVDIKPEETKEYKVVLDWKNGENTVGLKENIAEIIGSENAFGVKDQDQTDDRDNASVIVAIGTGDSTYVVITAIGMIVLIAAGVVIWKKRQ